MLSCLRQSTIAKPGNLRVPGAWQHILMASCTRRRSTSMPRICKHSSAQNLQKTKDQPARQTAATSYTDIFVGCKEAEAPPTKYEQGSYEFEIAEIAVRKQLRYALLGSRPSQTFTQKAIWRHIILCMGTGSFWQVHIVLHKTCSAAGRMCCKKAWSPVFCQIACHPDANPLCIAGLCWR